MHVGGRKLSRKYYTNLSISDPSVLTLAFSEPEQELKRETDAWNAGVPLLILLFTAGPGTFGPVT